MSPTVRVLILLELVWEPRTLNSLFKSYMLFDSLMKRFDFSGREEHNHTLFAFSVLENVPGAFMQFI